MSMMTCKECGNAVSSRAGACPSCGVRFATKVNSWRFVSLVLVVTVVVWIVALAMNPSELAERQKPMRVEVLTSPQQIGVRNLDMAEIAGKTATIYLNGTPPNGWTATCRVPSPGGLVTVPLFEFVKKDGERFNPATRAITELWIGGDGYAFASFTP